MNQFAATVSSSRGLSRAPVSAPDLDFMEYSGLPVPQAATLAQAITEAKLMRRNCHERLEGFNLEPPTAECVNLATIRTDRDFPFKAVESGGYQYHGLHEWLAQHGLVPAGLRDALSFMMGVSFERVPANVHVTLVGCAPHMVIELGNDFLIPVFHATHVHTWVMGLLPVERALSRGSRVLCRSTV